MKKIALIAFREFNVRIRNKTFLISTILLPIGIILFYGAIIVFMSNDFETYNIGIIDQSKLIDGQLKNTDNFNFIPISKSLSVEDAENQNYSAIIQLPTTKDSLISGNLQATSYTKLGIITKSKLEDKLQDIIEKERYSYANIDSKIIDTAQKRIQINYSSAPGNDENELKETISYGLGFGFGFLMYMILSIYGSQVMRGVMEEKTNRIVEVIISSVKPFELLMGKIIGIAMVSFLQLICWGTIIFIVNILLGILIGASQMSEIASNATIPQAGTLNLINDPEVISLFNNLKQIDYLPIMFGFVFYFLGGFFLYSSLFASVGSAVGDDPQDVQQLMIPIMLPIILSFMLLTKAINNPNSTEAVIGSIVPFTSPVIMMSRLVFGIGPGVPLWQLILSMVVLIGTTVFFIFLAGRIYRVGILLYGKKVGWKEMIKWLFMK
jgi:ABC-2 type transport system permease protein